MYVGDAVAAAGVLYADDAADVSASALAAGYAGGKAGAGVTGSYEYVASAAIEAGGMEL